MSAGDNGTVFRGDAYWGITDTGDIVLVPSTGGVVTIDGQNFATKADLTGEGGVLLSSQVPDLAITETFTVADEAARLALNVQEGDVAVQQDNSIAYIFTGGDPSVDANWSAISVAPVNGRTIEPARINNQDYNESVVTHTTASGTVDLDLAAANVHHVEAVGNVTLTFSNVTTTPQGNSLLVYVTDDDGTGPHTISWPASVVWNGGNTVGEVAASSNVEISLMTGSGGTEWRARRSGRRFQ